MKRKPLTISDTYTIQELISSIREMNHNNLTRASAIEYNIMKIMEIIKKET